MYQYVYKQQQAVNISEDLAEFKGRGLFYKKIWRLHLNKQTDITFKYNIYTKAKIQKYVKNHIFIEYI